MSKIELVPFKGEHVSLMDLREWDKKFLAAAPDLAAMSSNYFENNAMGFSVVLEEVIIGAGGLVPIFKTNWEAWVFTTPLFEKYGVRIAVMARKLLDNFFKSSKVLRVQAPIDSKYPTAIRFAEAMGLWPEATLRRYGPEGQDFIMYARVK
jgi:hypothetical protein